MAVNKVEANGEILIDLTNDTVQASDVLKGKTLHLASGVRVEGTYDHDSKQDTFVDLWEAEVGSAGVNELDIDELSDFIENYSTLLVTISNEFNNSEIINSGTASTAYCPLTDGFMRGVDAAFVLIVVPYISDPIHYDHILAYVFLSQRMPMPEPNPKSIMVTGTRDESSGLDKLTGLYLRKIVGIPISGWKLAVLSGYMPLTFPSNGDDLLNYRVYGSAEGAGVQTGNHYTIPITVKSGTKSKDTVIPIGDTKLMAGDYVDYETGKIYKAKRIHEDTVTIDGIEWDILDYDHDEVYKADGTRAKHTVTIQTHDIIDILQYSARQAAFAFPNGLAAGTYKFTVGAQPWVAGDVNKVLAFTLVNAIPAGGQLVFNGAYNQTLVGTTISVFSSPTSTTKLETVTITEGDTGTDLGTILRSKTDTVNSIDRAMRGSNNWLESAMRQYLNSDKAAGSVWSPQTVFDRPPAWASTTAGFLHGIDPDFVAVLGNVKKTTGLNNISDGGGTAVHDEKFFLLSRSEVYMGDEYTGGEGTPYAYYKNYSDNQSPSTDEDKNRIKYRAGVARHWWLRSPTAGGADSVRLVLSSGAWNFSTAVIAYGVAPACCIILDDMDDWVKQTFYTEKTIDLPAIETFKGENTLDSTETLGEVTIKGKIKH